MKNYKNYILEKKIQKKMPIPKDVLLIAYEFEKAGKDLFVVGGAVRDFLQGKLPHDYDLVTNALPNESKKILKDWNVSDEQGKNFGVLRIYTKEEPAGHELATYRKDIAKDIVVPISVPSLNANSAYDPSPLKLQAEKLLKYLSSEKLVL